MSLMMETVITFFAAAFERDVMMAMRSMISLPLSSASTEFFGFRLKKDHNFETTTFRNPLLES